MEGESAKSITAEEASAIHSYKIKYAGLVPEISSDIDPSGRTDLLKILDKAKLNGHITAHASKSDFAEDAIFDIYSYHIQIRSMENLEVLLTVPVDMIASVGFVREEALNILPIKIGERNGNREVYDLAVVYCQQSENAEVICRHLEDWFQQVYKEAVSSLESRDLSSFKRSSGSCASPLCDRPQFITGSNTDLSITIRNPTQSSPNTSDSGNTADLVNDYITMLSACLSHEELRQFATLMKRWQEGNMPILEFAQKLMELYGTERKHLLARMRHLLRGANNEDVEALNCFLHVNAVTENAASPLATGEFSLTTDSSPGVFDNISAYVFCVFVEIRTPRANLNPLAPRRYETGVVLPDDKCYIDRRRGSEAHICVSRQQKKITVAILLTTHHLLHFTFQWLRIELSSR
uniref:CCM2_C domain-containing protein n=1 Tax=Steinernema glaseri TaxID=37863 RepID=A0A1I7ZAR3_9BILA